ncbi:DUF4389 domain-containing protein [Candidatus Marithrix sp. Canyon 246]|uniref:DUF4389 domain-containing protein n=1 Tax=Candidatus Marithrix sp. Canyon 246 TaxID=1827136 RepID=UPI000849FAB5|nr:DUF4389 domain-containing protein [Candidatus Marithrix sp. Canyon 246]
MQLKENIKSSNVWMRGFFIFLYAMISYVAISLTFFVIFFQFGSLLFTGKLNQRLLPFSQSLSILIHQIFNFLTFNSDEKPFPLGNWPTK